VLDEAGARERGMGRAKERGDAGGGSAETGTDLALPRNRPPLPWFPAPAKTSGPDQRSSRRRSFETTASTFEVVSAAAASEADGSAPKDAKGLDSFNGGTTHIPSGALMGQVACEPSSQAIFVVTPRLAATPRGSWTARAATS
jgi:hypothetical protein